MDELCILIANIIRASLVVGGILIVLIVLALALA